MKRFAAILILILGIALAAEPSLSGDIEEITTEGYGNIFQGEKLIARDVAIKDALRVAVEQVVGTLITSQSKTENYQLISDEIYSKAQGYVEKYEIVSESAQGDTYKVTVKALVSKAGIKDKLSALRLLLVQENMPRVVVFLKQNLYGDGWNMYYDNSSIAEELIQKQLLSKGFFIIDKTQRAANLDRAAVQSAIEGDAASAQKIAMFYNADLIITGTVVGNTQEQNLYGGFLSASVDMAIKVIKSDTAEIIAVQSKNHKLAPVSDKVTGINKAMELLVPKIIDALTEDVMAKWSSGSRMVHITLKGITYTNYNKFAGFISERIRMVDKVYKRGFTSGVAEMDLETRKNAEEIAEELSLREKDMPFAVEIMDVTRDSITLKKVQ